MPFTVRESDLGRYHDDANHWNEVYRGLILPAAHAANLECERDDEDSSSRLIAENIWRKIEAADVILCDLSAHNPNVYLELGWALRADQRFVLIKDDVTRFNFDLNQFFTFQYSHLLQPISLERSVEDLANVLRATLSDEERRYSIVKKVSIDLRALEAAREGNIEVSLLKELLEEVRLSKQQPAASRQFEQNRVSFRHVRDQRELAALLPGTTWRKKNQLEHVIFSDPPKFYNNHAGHPMWRENEYTLDDAFGSMTLKWGADGFTTPCRFNRDFSEFVEMKNPRDGVWALIATEPHRPGWGV
jgi:hypothetical protein